MAVNMASYIGQFINNRAKGGETLTKNLADSPFKKFTMELQQKNLQLAQANQALNEEKLKLDSEIKRADIALRGEALAQRAIQDKQNNILKSASIMASLNPEEAANFLTKNGIPVKYDGVSRLKSRGGSNGEKKESAGLTGTANYSGIEALLKSEKEFSENLSRKILGKTNNKQVENKKDKATTGIQDFSSGAFGVLKELGSNLLGTGGN